MPPTLTDRIALQLFRAVVGHMRGASLRLDKAGRAVPSDTLRSAMSQLAGQLAKQGLVPADLDRPEGRDALAAVAGTVVVRMTGSVISFLPLPVEWKHVVDAADRHAEIFASQVRT